jgi:DNA-binding beta-propeller fold protein YncE
MRGFKIAAAALGLIIALGAAPASAWNRGNVQVLTVLPDLLNQPGVKSSVEGLTVGQDGNIYVPTFGFNTNGALAGNAQLFVISPNGKIIRNVAITCSACPTAVSPHMLGLAFNPSNGALWVLDFGAGMVLNVDPVTGTSSLLAGPIMGSGLNALTFDKGGNGYVSDSFNGVIWKVPPAGSPSATPWFNGARILCSPPPPPLDRSSLHRSGQTASSSTTSIPSCSSPTPRIIRSSRSR